MLRYLPRQFRQVGLRQILRNQLRRVRPRRLAPIVHPGPYSDGLWGEVERSLAYREEPTPLHALNRKAHAKAFHAGLAPLPWLDGNSCSIRLQFLRKKKLSELRRSHRDASPRAEGIPIILLKVEEATILIDGANRINKCVNSSECDGLDAIIISVNSSSR